MKNMNNQNQAAAKESTVQISIKNPVFLFEENRSGERMGKPGDANNVYHARWFEFYTLGTDGWARHEATSLNFRDPSNAQPVSGGNGISGVDVIEAFRKANPGRSVVVLSIEPFSGDLEGKMTAALQKFNEAGEALLILPPLQGSHEPAKAAH